LSTKLLSEYKKNYEIIGQENQWVYNNSVRALANGSLGESDFFQNQIEQHLDAIKYLEMRGGEVFVDPTAIQFIKKLIHGKKQSSKIFLDITTNVVSLNSEIVETLNHFKGGTLRCSVDAFAEENEYIRHPSKWQILLDRMRLLKNLHKDWNLVVQPTLMTYQICSIHRLLSFMDEFCQADNLNFTFSFSVVRDTPHLNPSIVPLNYRIESARKVHSYLENSFLCNKSGNHKLNRKFVKGLIGVINAPFVGNYDLSLKKFIEHTHLFDKIRNQNVLDVFPHLEPLFSLCKENKSIRELGY